MHVDENLNNLKPGLYCVSTPIGNLGDITLRALEILKNSDLILCEDTRVSKKLLNKFKISKKLISNHKFNENKNLNFILELLENNKIISIISDAGTPAISDPGKILINKCVEKKINKLIKKMTIKNIVNEINKNRVIPKKIIYDYCLKLKNEN